MVLLVDMAIRAAAFCIVVPWLANAQNPINYAQANGGAPTQTASYSNTNNNPVSSPQAFEAPPLVRPFMAPLVPLPPERHHYSKCLDGTQGGYYILPGDPKLFVIHLQGGGGCINLLSCRVRTFSPLGSSKNWPLFHSFRWAGNFQNTDEVVNKDFGMATMVMLPYCSADMWSGRTMKPSKRTFGFWFSGHHIVDSVFEELMRKHNFKDADLVVLTGHADGGVGTVLHLDYLADKLEKAGSKARVVGAPIGGFSGLVNLYVKPYTGPFATPFVKSDATVLPTYTTAWNSIGPKRCTAKNKGNEWRCILPAFIMPTLKTSCFFVQAQTDSTHLPKYYGLPSDPMIEKNGHGHGGTTAFHEPVRQWLTNYVTLEKQEISSLLGMPRQNAIGFYSPACWTHTYFDDVRVNGQTYLEAFGTWLRYPRTEIWMDNCGIHCNPTCVDPAQIKLFNEPQMP